MFHEMFQFFNDGVLRRSPRCCSSPSCPSCTSTFATSDDSRWKHDRDSSTSRQGGRARQGLAAPLRAARSAAHRGRGRSACCGRFRRIGLLVTSVRNPALDRRQSGWWTALLNPFAADQWTLANYQQVLGAGGMGNAFLNSLIVTIPSTVIPITIAAFAAYAFAWIPFRGRGDPVHDRRRAARRAHPDVAHPDPARSTAARACTARSWASGWRTRASACRSRSSCSTTSSRSCRATCSSRPPLTAPRTCRRSSGSSCRCPSRPLGAFAIFQFLWVWNDLLVALVVPWPDDRPARHAHGAVLRLLGSHGGQWQLLTAGAFITMLVPLIVFLVLQRAFVRGILAGSVK